MNMTVMSIKRKIMWEPEVRFEEVVPDAVLFNDKPVMEFKQTSTPVYTSNETTYVKRGYKTRIGNGHQKMKVRDLNAGEKDGIRYFFMKRDGQIKDDDCVEYRKAYVVKEISIPQVTGFVTYLHATVAEGRTELKDLGGYMEWMRVKYHDMWVKYNRADFVRVREENAALKAKGLPATARIKK